MPSYKTLPLAHERRGLGCLEWRTVPSSFVAGGFIVSSGTFNFCCILSWSEILLVITLSYITCQDCKVISQSCMKVSLGTNMKCSVWFRCLFFSSFFRSEFYRKMLIFIVTFWWVLEVKIKAKNNVKVNVQQLKK